MTARKALRLAATIAIGLLVADAALWSQDRGPGRRLSTAWVDGREVIEGEVLVRYRTTSGALERARAEFQAESDEVEPVGRRGTRRMRSRRLGTRAMLQALRANPDVEFAEPNFVIRLDVTPDDPSFGNLWGLFNSGQVISGSTGIAGADIKAPEAWNVTTGSRANVVGVIDTGIAYNHPDLLANIWSAPAAFSVTIGGVVINCAAGTHGFNAINNTCNPMDDHYHGTHVAGTIGAVGNNGIGVAGVNWVASMMGLKFLSASGSGSTSNAIKAIEFAIQAKAVFGAAANVRILSNSWGGGGYSQSLRNQIDAAGASDMLFVAAAGNNALNTDVVPHYPSSYPTANMVSVAATTNRELRAWFSNYGATSVHLGAPGQSILSTYPNNNYTYLSGTSMATPQVAGAAALVLSACPMGTADLKNVLLTTVDPTAAMSGLTTTGGRLNANAAVQSCINSGSILTVNTLSVVPGGMIEVVIAGGPGLARDWVGLYRPGTADSASVDWLYLDGTKTPPSVGQANVTLQFPAPLTAGTYHLRLFTNGDTKVATSPLVTVAPLPAITINDATVTEGHSGPRTATFTVTLNPVQTSRTVTVAYATSDLSATTANTDYSAANGVLTFNPGITTRTFVVTVNGDTTIEPTETFVVNLSNATNAVISDPQGVGTITTDDFPPPSLTLTSPLVPPGGTIEVSVTNALGTPNEWIGLFAAAAPDNTYLDWNYLNGLKSLPATGSTSATVRFPAPTTTGTYQLRLIRAGVRLATVDVIVGSAPTLSISDVTVTEGNSGTTTANFTVTLAPAQSSQTVTVSYATANITATANTDYVATAGTLTFNPSITTRTIGVVVNGDTTIEQAETFAVNLSNAAGAVISDSQGVGTISTDEAPPPPTLTLTSQLVQPGGTIEVAVANGSGAANEWIGLYVTAAPDNTYLDWNYLNGLKNMPATGFTSATVRFPAPATTGTYQLRLIRSGVRLATVDVIVGSAPTLSINDVTVVEGNSGTTTATFTVAITPAPAGQATVAFATADGTATANGDYLATSGTLTFTSLVTTRTISVTIVGDTVTELAETFAVNLSSPTNAVVVDAQGVGTIATDDAPPPPTLTLTAPLVPPGGLIEVAVSNASGNPREWLGLYAPSAPDNTFLEWTYLNGLKTLPLTGLTDATLQFAAPTTPGAYELRLFTVGYGRLAAATVIVGLAPVLTINDAVVTEGNSGTTTAMFTVSLNPPLTSGSVTVNYATGSGSATAGSDFVTASGTLTFGPSVTTRTIAVAVNGDTLAEPSETFVVNLSSPTNAVIGDAQGVGTIATDDALPTTTLTASPAVPGGMITITVANALGNPSEWIGLYAPSTADNSFMDWNYLNGTKSRPASGSTNTTLQFAAPDTPGIYELRLFTVGYLKLATVLVTVAY